MFSVFSVSLLNLFSDMDGLPLHVSRLMLYSEPGQIFPGYDTHHLTVVIQDQHVAEPERPEQVEHLGTTPDDYPTLLLGQDARKHLFPKRVPEGQLHVWNKSLPNVILSKSQITGKFIPEGVINHAPQAPKVNITVNQCITVDEEQERE